MYRPLKSLGQNHQNKMRLVVQGEAWKVLGRLLLGEKCWKLKGGSRDTSETSAASSGAGTIWNMATARFAFINIEHECDVCRQTPQQTHHKHIRHCAGCLTSTSLVCVPAELFMFDWRSRPVRGCSWLWHLLDHPDRQCWTRQRNTEAHSATVRCHCIAVFKIRAVALKCWWQFLNTHRRQAQTIRGVEAASSMCFVLVSWQNNRAGDADPEQITHKVKCWVDFLPRFHLTSFILSPSSLKPTNFRSSFNISIILLFALPLIPL